MRQKLVNSVQWVGRFFADSASGRTQRFNVLSTNDPIRPGHLALRIPRWPAEFKKEYKMHVTPEGTFRLSLPQNAPRRFKIGVQQHFTGCLLFGDASFDQESCTIAENVYLAARWSSINLGQRGASNAA
jgi:hypothetical protein